MDGQNLEERIADGILWKEKGRKKMSSRKAERAENQQSVNKGKLGKVADVAQVIRFPWDVHVNHFKHFWGLVFLHKSNLQFYSPYLL